MERVNQQTTGPFRRYAVPGLIGLIALAGLQQLATLDGVPDAARVVAFYAGLPGWTLLVANPERLHGTVTVSVGWLAITGFSFLIWFATAVALVEAARWTRHCIPARSRPGSIRRFLLTVAFVGLAATALSTPFESTVVPEWRVHVSDQEGHPVSNALVRQTWQHHSVEMEGHQQELRTAADGIVLFPRRRVNASLIHRVVGPMLTVAQTSVQATTGPHATVLVFADEGQGHLDYDPPGPPPENLILKPNP